MWRLFSYLSLTKQDGKTRYKDIISQSVEIHPGPPAIYQVKPKEKKIDSLTRLSVGERDLNRTNRTILLVGETGAGKSSLINALFNYTMGVKFEDDVWFQIVAEEGRSQTESQTSDVVVYDIFGFEGQILPFSLTIIDTPGFGDTRGQGHDEEVAERLLDLFGSVDGVHEVNTVGLVMKASDNRLTDRLCYVLDSVTSLFGKNLEGKIVVLVTHSDGRKPVNVLKAVKETEIKCAKNEENQAVHFKFNNSQKEDRTEDVEYLKSLNKISETGFKELTDFMENSAPQTLMITTEVIRERKNLNACITNLQERIKSIDLKQTETNQIQEALKKDGDKMNQVIEVDEVYKEKITLKGKGFFGLFFFKGNVCFSCNICEENCLYPCTDGGAGIIQNGHCIVCTKKCPSSAHSEKNWMYVAKTRKVQKKVQDVKEGYEKLHSESQNKTNALKSLDKQLEQLTAQKNQFVDEAYRHIVRLEEIALKVNSRKSIRHLSFLIEKMKEKGDKTKLKKLEEMKTLLDSRARLTSD